MNPKITVIILAAGVSSRMGQPKMILPWGGTTVLGKVITSFSLAGLVDILVITGGDRQLVEESLEPLSGKYPFTCIHNQLFLSSGMIGSLQCGLRTLFGSISNPITFSLPESGTVPLQHAALVALGDQPHVEVETIRSISTAFQIRHSPLIFPSNHGRRGHPWLIADSLWDEVIQLPPNSSPRDFINSHKTEIEYIPADDSIFQDIDTPDEYSEQKRLGLA